MQLRQPLNLRKPLQMTAHKLRPVLNLPFAGATSIDPRITYTGSNGTYFNSSGVLTTASTNVARFDYNPSTLAPRGLLIEEARTNSIRNNTMQGASAGTPGTDPTNWQITAAGGSLTTKSIVAVSTESGISYTDVRFVASGIVTAQIIFEQNTSVAASNGQTWTGSNYIRLVAGSTTNLTVSNRVAFRNGAGTIVTVQNNSVTPTSAALNTQRTTNTFTATDATTASVTSAIVVDFTGAGDITLRIGMPQLELGAFATSVISTSSAAVTRSADLASMTGTNFSSWYNQSQGTFVVKARMSAPAISAYGPYRIDDGTDNQRVMLRDSGGGLLGFVIVDGGVTQANLSAGNTITANALFSHAAAYQLNDIATSYNGAAVLTDNAATIPAVNRMLIGVGGTTTSYLNGWIQSIAYYPQRLPNTQLQGLTL